MTRKSKITVSDKNLIKIKSLAAKYVWEEDLIRGMYLECHDLKLVKNALELSLRYNYSPRVCLADLLSEKMKAKKRA